jgi:hypothetical protein
MLKDIQKSCYRRATEIRKPPSMDVSAMHECSIGMARSRHAFKARTNNGLQLRGMSFWHGVHEFAGYWHP